MRVVLHVASVHQETASSSACALAQGVNENAPVEESMKGLTMLSVRVNVRWQPHSVPMTPPGIWTCWVTRSQGVVATS
jgi:hypothetical protein